MPDYGKAALGKINENLKQIGDLSNSNSDFQNVIFKQAASGIYMRNGIASSDVTVKDQSTLEAITSSTFGTIGLTVSNKFGNKYKVFTTVTNTGSVIASNVNRQVIYNNSNNANGIVSLNGQVVANAQNIAIGASVTFVDEFVSNQPFSSYTGIALGITTPTNGAKLQITQRVYNITNLYYGVSLWSGKKVLAIGDSLTASLKWQNTVVGMHNCTITTHAKGGIGLKTMIDGDTNSPVLPALTTTDVTGIDLIVLFGGMNERATTYGTLGDVYPTQDTLFGRMQYVINSLYSLLNQANNLKCKILVVLPHCPGKYGYIDVDGYGEYPSGTGQTLEKLVNNLKMCAQYNNLRVVDLWHDSGIGKNTWKVYASSSTPTLTTPDNTLPFPNNADQLHLNDTGYALVGQIIAEEMNRM